MSGDGLLVLSRKVGEGITIQGGMHIVVCEIRGDKVRLGLNFPRNLRILRDELLPIEDTHTGAKTDG